MLPKATAHLAPVVIVCHLTAAGCVSGPKVLNRTLVQRTPDSRSSEEEQLLINIVRSRYNDLLIEEVAVAPSIPESTPIARRPVGVFYTPISVGAVVDLVESG